jgi:dTDP-glucose 4,6-dehydratase
VKTLLVTGGAGFIGSNFVRYIRTRYPDYRVVVLDALTYAGRLANLEHLRGTNSHLVIRHGDVCDARLVDQAVAAADVVVHIAAESHVDRSILDDRIFFETNVLGTHAVANAVVRHRSRIERFILMSSSEVYGTAEQEPMTEDHPLNAANPYAAAKAGADRLVYAYWLTYGIPVVIVRPFNNYGPRQHLEKVIPRFITSALLGEPLTIHGNGRAERDWLFVQDHCAALDRILHHDIRDLAGQVINLGTGVATDVCTIAQWILELTGRNASLLRHVADRPGQVSKHIAGTTKAEQLLGWVAETSLEEGLAQTVQWYTDNREWWEPFYWTTQAASPLPRPLVDVSATWAAETATAGGDPVDGEYALDALENGGLRRTAA